MRKPKNATLPHCPGETQASFVSAMSATICQYRGSSLVLIALLDVRGGGKETGRTLCVPTGARRGRHNPVGAHSVRPHHHSKLAPAVAAPSANRSGRSACTSKGG